MSKTFEILNEFDKNTKSKQIKQEENNQKNINKYIYNENIISSIKLVNRKKMASCKNVKVNLSPLRKNIKKNKNDNNISSILSNPLYKSTILPRTTVNKVNSVKIKKKKKENSVNYFSLNKSNSDSKKKKKKKINQSLNNISNKEINLNIKEINTNKNNNHKILNLKKNIYSPILRSKSPISVSNISFMTNTSINLNDSHQNLNISNNKYSINLNIMKSIRKNSLIKKEYFSKKKNKNNSYQIHINLKNKNNDINNSKEKYYKQFNFTKINKNIISMTQRNNYKNKDKQIKQKKEFLRKKQNYRKNNLTTIQNLEKRKIINQKQLLKPSNNSNISFQTNPLSQSTTIKSSSRNNSNLNISNNNNINNSNKENNQKCLLTSEFFSSNKSFIFSKKIISIYSLSMTGFSGKSDLPKINQDKYFIEKINDYDSTFIGVCDGHGENGHLVSEFIKEELPKNFIRELKKKFIDKSILNDTSLLVKCFNDSFLYTSIKLTNNSDIDINFSGSTCASILITHNNLITANVGDSRIIKGILNKKENNINLNKENTLNNNKININYNNNNDENNINKYNYYFSSEQLTTDHNPMLEKEYKRILNYGGRIEKFKDVNGKFVGPKRVWLKNKNIPGLAMTRSFGDQIAVTVGVISEPEVKIYNIENKDKFLIIASDGLFEYLNNDEIVKIVGNFYFDNNCKSAVHKLYNEAHKRWKKNDICIDDITIIVVFFD